MSAVMTLLSAGEAQSLTQRIKLTVSNIRDNLVKLRNLVDEAKHSNVWSVLGSPLWTAYLADTLADEPMRLGREERQELVGHLSGEGLSTRAMAPIVGVSQKTVDWDLRELFDSPAPVRDSTPRIGPAQPAAIAVPVTGLDGKTYSRSAPKAVLATAADSLDYDAKQIAQRVSDALQTLHAFRTPENRDRPGAVPGHHRRRGPPSG